MVADGYHSLFILLCLFSFIIISSTAPTPQNDTAAAAAAYDPVDLILLNCGASSKSTDISNRSWDANDLSSYGRENAANLSKGSTASYMHHSLPDLVPYQSARVFYSIFTYSFPLEQMGHKFVRLYFYPVTYAGLNTSEFFFSVTANAYMLLSNFNAFLDYDAWSQPTVVKEFIINVGGKQRIDLTFYPRPNSFAFINGIEIVSLPDELYNRDRDIKHVPSQLYNVVNDTGLQTFYRLNVGGADVRIQDDTGMFRHWANDDAYIYGSDYGFTPHDEDHIISYTDSTPPYTAPKIVYRTSRTLSNWSKSLEWAFPVDSGFNYLLRLHFCEIQLEITKQNERVFTINIDNQTAEIEADVIFWTGGTGIPIFRDYIAFVPADDGRTHGRTDLRLSLFPNNDGHPLYSSALLNGLEIFKLNGPNWNFAAPSFNSPQPESPPSPGPRERKKGPASIVVYVVVGSVISLLSLIATVSFLIFWLRRKVKDSTSPNPSWMALQTSSRSAPRSNGSGTPMVRRRGYRSRIGHGRSRY